MRKSDLAGLKLSRAEAVRMIKKRLSDVRPGALAQPLPKSRAVVAAEKLSRAWETENREYLNTQIKAIDRQKMEIEDALILGDAAKALKLLQKLEAARASC
jgi:hypothetical protein